MEIQNKEAIIQILQPRIERDTILKEKGHNVESILGPTPYTNKELALQLRADEERKKVRYHGINVFCDLWMSNTREIISLFANLVDKGRKNIMEKDWPKEKPLVSEHDQDKVFRNAGSRFHGLLVSATDPTKKLYEIPTGGRSYGEHLQKIADAFREIADFELQNKTSKNVDRIGPKQARRIEIKDVSEDIPDDILPFYRGMIRYGLFIRDWRGKSVSGKAVPRLYLRSILIPYYTITFSKRDAVTMTWEEFCNFLRNPKDFVEYWKTYNKPKETNLLQKRFPGMEP